ncbi:MAG: IS5 family transposase [Thaumarchaeota archaeon]|nr:IS5 family transposase [Nitrososphaerota archaeon]
MRNWIDYNEKLVRRYEIFISYDCFKSWDKELAEMNCKKQGRKFLFPDSFMKLVGYARAYFGLPYRQTEGLLRTYCNTIPKIPDYTAIHKRITKLDIKLSPKVGNNIIIAIDSTGIKVSNRGEWRRQVWQMKRRFLKIHVGVDIESNQVVSLKVTDDSVFDGHLLPHLVESAQQHAQVIKVLGDGAYDSNENFAYLSDDKIIPCIKARKNPYGRRGRGNPRELYARAQSNYQYWRNSVSYGKRWTVESAFSVLKRMFGEHVNAHKRQNMEKELELKVSLYNRFMSE